MWLNQSIIKMMKKIRGLDEPFFFIWLTSKILYFLHLLLYNIEENFAQIHLPDW